MNKKIKSKKKRETCASIAEAAGKGGTSEKARKRARKRKPARKRAKEREREREKDLPIAEQHISRGRKEKEQNPAILLF